MIKKFLKIFTKSNINSPNRLQNLKNDPKIKKIFNSINDHSTESEILFVGGCVRQNIFYYYLCQNMVVQQSIFFPN